MNDAPNDADPTPAALITSMITDVYPLFADRPELDDVAFAMMSRLHDRVGNPPPFASWSDFSEAQVLRAKAAAALVWDAAVVAAARKVGERIEGGRNLPSRERDVRIGVVRAQDAVLAMRRLDGRDPDPFFEGIFRHHTCARCADGRLPCEKGPTNNCGNPRARND